MEPITREEALLSGEHLTPITRKEMFLAKMAGMDVVTPEPITREEMFLQQVLEEGGTGGGGWDGNLYKKTNKPLSTGIYMFSSDERIKTVTLPLCSCIDSHSFEYCNNLEQIVINKNSIGSGLSINPYAFNGCDSLQEATLYVISVDGIDSHAFSQCIALKRVSIIMNGFYEGVHYALGAFAFSDCESLENISTDTSSNSIRCIRVGECAFIRCKSLEKIELDGCIFIDEGAFEGCENLKTVIIPIKTEVCNITVTAFNETPLMTGEGHIYVPASMYEMYRTTYEAVVNELMPGFFDILFRKIEDYPEICG